jgi:sarcosine oxidase subunit alpha
VLEEGAQVVDPQGDPGRSIGHVTSSYRSAAVGHPIAMALVRGGTGADGRGRWRSPRPAGTCP